MKRVRAANAYVSLYELVRAYVRVHSSAGFTSGHPALRTSGNRTINSPRRVRVGLGLGPGFGGETLKFTERKLAKLAREVDKGSSSSRSPRHLPSTYVTLTTRTCKHSFGDRTNFRSRDEAKTWKKVNKKKKRKKEEVR